VPKTLTLPNGNQLLKLSGIELSSEARIHQYESKTGEVWRVSKRTTAAQLPGELCVDKSRIINLTDKLGAPMVN
jgi:hypothetical protein